MEGRGSTFREVLADFESRLHSAEFVAIDTELTGVDLPGEPDTFEESPQMRLEKNCRIAERYTLIQLGLTIVGRMNETDDGHMFCASYNLFAFPYMGPELVGNEPGFFCQASAMQFNAQHRVDFNKWISEGVPYLSRDDERRYLRKSEEYTNGNGDCDRRSGLLLLWKALCAARVPFVVHCPLDLFFLLAAFERRPLPRDDPQALAMMIRHCTPKVYDTAHLHGVLGQFKRLSLVKFCEDAKARYDELRESRSGLDHVPAVDFVLVGETAARYGRNHNGLAHEAGFDSLVTGQLFAYLRAIAPQRVKEAANRLFLYRSVEYLDLDRAVLQGEIGTSLFDLSRVTLLVAALDRGLEGNDAPRLIMAAGSQYRWMDATHLLVVLRASGGAAVRKAAELAAQVRGVVSWTGFDDWRAAQLALAAKGAAAARAAAEPPRGAAGQAPPMLFAKPSLQPPAPPEAAPPKLPAHVPACDVNGAAHGGAACGAGCGANGGAEGGANGSAANGGAADGGTNGGFKEHEADADREEDFEESNEGSEPSVSSSAATTKGGAAEPEGEAPGDLGGGGGRGARGGGQEWGLATYVAVGAASAFCSAVLLLLAVRNAHLAAAGARLLRRWRRR